MNKKRIFKIILIITSIPFITIFILGLWNAFFGFTFFLSTSYGIEAFFDTCFILGWLLCVFPVLPVCLLYQIIYLIVFLVNKKKTK